jgi:hypothetical protein
MRAAADVASGFDSAHAGHVDIEKTHIGLADFKLIDGISPIARSRNYCQFRPGLDE